jgi:hypothetical protein
VLPAPTWLLTWISPPIILTSRWLIASPKPVPPYFRGVELSAWQERWDDFFWGLEAMHATRQDLPATFAA